MTTPHDATYYPPSSTSPYGTPDNTAALHFMYVGYVADKMRQAFNKVAPQYRLLTGVHEPGSTSASLSIGVEDYDPSWNIATIKDWVGDDVWKAETALSIERDAPHPRSTLITWLEDQLPG